MGSKERFSEVKVTKETNRHAKQKDHGTTLLSANIRKRKPMHYRRVVPEKQEQNMEAERNENRDERDYATIGEVQPNSSNRNADNGDDTYLRPIDNHVDDTYFRPIDNHGDDTYLHPISETEDRRITKRKNNIRRWKGDLEQKKQRLWSTSSSTSIQDNHDEFSETDEVFIPGEQIDKKDEKQAALKDKNWREITFIILLTISFAVIVFFGMFFMFESEGRMTKLMEVQEAHIETLKSQVTSMKDQIMHLEKDT